MVFLSLPIVCLLNWSSFVVALDHGFGGTGIVTMVVGPIADYVSWPVVIAQNWVPLTRPWDTAFGIATISMMETAALVLCITVWHKRSTSKPASRLASSST
jgi:hypothetical protein